MSDDTTAEAQPAVPDGRATQRPPDDRTATKPGMRSTVRPGIRPSTRPGSEARRPAGVAPAHAGTMRHKGYTAKVQYDDSSGLLRGEVVDLRDEIAFAAASVAQLRREFHAAVDGYLLDCATRGVEPAKPFSGKVLLRMPPDLHRKAAITAAALSVSLNDFLVASIEVGVARIAAARSDEAA